MGMNSTNIFLLVLTSIVVVGTLYRLLTGQKLEAPPKLRHRGPLDMLNPHNHGLLPGDLGYEEKHDKRPTS